MVKLAGYVSLVKDLMNILFFIVGSTVAVLTYIQARRSILSPIRTETFKIQLKAMEDVFTFFQSSSMAGRLQDLDYIGVVDLNVRRMAFAYADVNFPEEDIFSAEERDRLWDETGSMFMSRDHASDYLVDPDPIRHRAFAEESPAASDPEDTRPKWLAYEHDCMLCTKRFVSKTHELGRLCSIPVLPKQLRNLLLEYFQLIHQNIELIGVTITEAAKTMPARYPDSSSLTELNPHWVWNAFNQVRVDLDVPASSILEYVNKYLRVEELLPATSAKKLSN